MKKILCMLLFLICVNSHQIDGVASQQFYQGIQHTVAEDPRTLDGVFFGANGNMRLSENLDFHFQFNTDKEDYFDVSTVALSYGDMYDGIEYRISLGDLLVPVGLYEMQRIFPNPYTPPTLNDSYANNLFPFNRKHQYGMKLEANVDLYSITYAAFIHRDNNQRIEGSGKVDLIEIDGWSQFFSVVYDNRSDLLLDFEWQVEQYSFENSHRKIEYTTNTFRTGIEYRFTKDMFLIHEHSIRLINDSGRPWVGQTYSLLWDKTPYTPYIGYTDTKYDYIHSNELTIGSGYAFENGLNVRINYKYVRQKEFTFPEFLSKIMYDCTDCIPQFIPDSYRYSQSMRTNVYSGVEVSLTYTF